MAFLARTRLDDYESLANEPFARTYRLWKTRRANGALV